MFLGDRNLISWGGGLEEVCISAECVEPLFLSGGEVGGVLLVCWDRRLLFEMDSTRTQGSKALFPAIPCLLEEEYSVCRCLAQGECG
jgi:hypothetical protein